MRGMGGGGLGGGGAGRVKSTGERVNYMVSIFNDFVVMIHSISIKLSLDVWL